MYQISLETEKSPYFSYSFVSLEIKYQNRTSSPLKLNTIYLIGFPIANNLNTLKIDIRFI